MTFSLSAMTVRRATALMHLVDSPYGQFLFPEKETQERASLGLETFQQFE